MAPWRFMDCWPRKGYNPVRAWETKQSLKTQEAFRAALDVLAQTPDWRDPPIEHLYRDLSGDEAGLGEIVFESHEEEKGTKKRRLRRFRAFVKLRDNEHDCVLLTCAEHWPRHRQYEPPDAPSNAKKYWTSLEARNALTDIHHY